MLGRGWCFSVRVLVTRALEDAHRTAQELAKRGHEALVAPLSEIRFLDTGEPDLSGVQAILATSTNGIRAFASRCGRTDIPLFAVGANTAATAHSAGFVRVSSADGDSSALAAAIRNTLDPQAGAILHIADRSGAHALHRQLAEAGFESRAWELYEVIARERLPAQVVAAFNQGAVDAVLVLSPESGRILVDALEASGVAAKCVRVVACCISRASAAKIRKVEFAAIRIAEKPNLDAVLALLDSGPAVRIHSRTGLGRC